METFVHADPKAMLKGFFWILWPSSYLALSTTTTTSSQKKRLATWPYQ